MNRSWRLSGFSTVVNPCWYSINASFGALN